MFTVFLLHSYLLCNISLFAVAYLGFIQGGTELGSLGGMKVPSVFQGQSPGRGSEEAEGFCK